jgi:hypothetical protein
MSAFEERLKIEERLQELYEALDHCKEALLDVKDIILVLGDRKVLLLGQKNAIIQNLEFLTETGPDSPVLTLFDKDHRPGRYLELKDKIQSVEAELRAVDKELKDANDALVRAEISFDLLPKAIKESEKQLEEYGQLIFIFPKEVTND